MLKHDFISRCFSRSDSFSQLVLADMCVYDLLILFFLQYLYKTKLRQKQTVRLKDQPPTTNAAFLHVLRIYFQVSQNDLSLAFHTLA